MATLREIFNEEATLEDKAEYEAVKPSHNLMFKVMMRVVKKAGRLDEAAEAAHQDMGNEEDTKW